MSLKTPRCNAARIADALISDRGRAGIIVILTTNLEVLALQRKL